ncbi:hypothetical protein EAX61_00310 [Dokdonia sinensis]|uniref:Uncharacterized protein n=2 Tax=Dokdonia sinensis TaxID=2479847 RepID=A0A3M0GG02_9FLAO|nr:hypothetical protein EAX61_00310 [Dokdonia sinensis]
MPINTVDYSKSKQQKFFPKILKKKGIYLGMTLEKLKKTNPKATPAQASEFKIEYTETSNSPEVVAYTYLLTKTENPQLYSIAIEYRLMESVHPLAETILGKTNHQGEWRMSEKDIKEDFMMGAWTFGHKLVYGATLEGSEWEDGFQD